MGDQSQGREMKRPDIASIFGVLSVAFAAIRVVWTGLIGAIGTFTSRVARGIGTIGDDFASSLGEVDPEVADAAGEMVDII